MGFPNSKHIIKYAKGQTIESMIPDKENGDFRLVFKSGEAIQFYPYPYTGRIICVPYDKNGKVKQSVDILKKVNKTKGK